MRAHAPLPPQPSGAAGLAAGRQPDSARRLCGYFACAAIPASTSAADAAASASSPPARAPVEIASSGLLCTRPRRTSAPRIGSGSGPPSPPCLVQDCMERRKQLQANLRQPSDALLEWEAVAQWLRNDAVIGELQRVLAREADAYLDWAGYACTKVWPPIQASQILLSHVPAELFQVGSCSCPHRSTAPHRVSASSQSRILLMKQSV